MIGRNRRVAPGALVLGRDAGGRQRVAIGDSNSIASSNASHIASVSLSATASVSRCGRLPSGDGLGRERGASLRVVDLRTEGRERIGGDAQRSRARRRSAGPAAAMVARGRWQTIGVETVALVSDLYVRCDRLSSAPQDASFHTPHKRKPGPAALVAGILREPRIAARSSSARWRKKGPNCPSAPTLWATPAENSVG